MRDPCTLATRLMDTGHLDIGADEMECTHSLSQLLTEQQQITIPHAPRSATLALVGPLEISLTLILQQLHFLVYSVQHSERTA